jgi:hypothetical protein
MAVSEKGRENRLRRQAGRLGLVLRKSRARLWSLDNRGEYMVIDANSNFIVAGEKFDRSLDQVAKFLDDYERKVRRAE